MVGRWVQDQGIDSCLPHVHFLTIPDPGSGSKCQLLESIPLTKLPMNACHTVPAHYEFGCLLHIYDSRLTHVT